MESLKRIHAACEAEITNPELQALQQKINRKKTKISAAMAEYDHMTAQLDGLRAKIPNFSKKVEALEDVKRCIQLIEELLKENAATDLIVVSDPCAGNFFFFQMLKMKPDEEASEKAWNELDPALQQRLRALKTTAKRCEVTMTLKSFFYCPADEDEERDYSWMGAEITIDGLPATRPDKYTIFNVDDSDFHDSIVDTYSNDSRWLAVNNDPAVGIQDTLVVPLKAYIFKREAPMPLQNTN